MPRFDARFKVIEELKEKKLWIKTSSHEMVHLNWLLYVGKCLNENKIYIGPAFM